MFISNAYAQSGAAAPAGFDPSSLVFFVVLFAVMYFVMVRPQMKRQKEHRAMIEALAKGDEIVTSGGLIGRVTKIGETVLNLEVANGVELQVQRSSVVQVLPKGTYK